MSETPSFDDVMNAARQWYYSEIRSLVDDTIARLKSEKPSDEYDAREWLTRDIDETTDGHQFVIYTAQAGMVCAASDNDGAYESEMGEKAPSVEAQARMAMRTDVWELLEARSDEWVPEESDESEE